jgi:hypothetical protein
MRAKPSFALASVLVSLLTATTMPADAACKRFAFLVNDYGKEGPTKDAKALLDKNISEWAAQNNIKSYATGPKNVSCELFLDFVVFDEHTCTASANVCWGPGVKANNNVGEQAVAVPDDGTVSEKPPAPMRKAEALGIAPQQAAANAAPPPAGETAAPTGAAPTLPVEQVVAPAEAPATHQPAKAAEATAPAAPAPSAPVETGALQTDKAAEVKPAPVVERHPAPVATDKERAAAAAAAATAAAAAERAAMAAEAAAEAAKEAAAAAVAASAASRGAVVPPLDHASGAQPIHNE